MHLGTVHVTKLAAADQQLRSATRMFFGGEDELAVHTVASAAYRLISDIKAERGLDEVGTVFLTKIFYVVRDYHRGELPDSISSDSEVMDWIRSMAEMLPIRADTQVEDISVEVSPALAREYWKDRNRVANFLKHADRDVGASISLDEVDNLLLLAQCWGSYSDISKHGLSSNEGLVFQSYLRVVNELDTDVSSPIGLLAQKLTELPESERLLLCSRMIHELNERNA